MNTPALKWNASTGAFSLVVQLTASRLGSDTNGRKYDLRVCATDKAGNIGLRTVGVGDGARQEQVDRDEKERRRPLDSSAAPVSCTGDLRGSTQLDAPARLRTSGSRTSSFELPRRAM